MRWRRRTGPPPDGAPQAADAGTDDAARQRRRMVHEQIEARGIRDPELLNALLTVPRHAFVDDAEPYGDHALSIGSGQTISQPYVVAVMTDAARPTRPGGWRDARVLEIGTGSGYQAAILATLGARLTTIERHADLAASATGRLRAAGHDMTRVEVRIADGSHGAPDAAPFDAILVTAASPSVPAPLVEQLAERGGKLVIPLGGRESQMLTVVQRWGDDVSERAIERVVFVPLVGEHGFAPGG